ncbi:MAG: hypothetical protein ABI537_17510 [Casimicrobiaceae bacterium]
MHTSDAASKRIETQCVCARLLLALALICAGAAAGAKATDAQPARVEVQIGVCDEPQHIVRALDLQRRGAPVETWLFDDAGMALFGRGLRLRLRLSERAAELTLKAAIADCKSLSAEYLPADLGKCEYDVHGSTVNSAVSLRRNLDTTMARALVAGNLALAEALSPAQVRYLDEALHVWPLPSGILPLGPIRTQSYRAAAARADVDIARLPGGERFIDISRKVAYDQGRRANAKPSRTLGSAGIAACADQSAQAVNKLRALLRQPVATPPARSP